MLFEEFGVDPGVFWDEVNATTKAWQASGFSVSPDTTYLNVILAYVESGKFADLSNNRLQELGGRLVFYPGMPDFLSRAKAHVEEQEGYVTHGITVEHYVVSTGLRRMILGSAVAKDVTDVWACEFVGIAGDRSDADVPISRVAYFLDNTTKTRAIWEINKGCNIDPGIDVNAMIAQEDRRVPIRNMLYIADGPSDIPVFSILNQYGGRTLGVYNPELDEHFRGVKRLRDQGRVQHFGEANYEPKSATARWILQTLEEMADRIVRDRERALKDRVQPPGGHVI